jgi:hypothetical protein
MKSFQFESIRLMSHRDGRARKIHFHATSTLVVGRNHTGKSSLIKALFRTLGAKPKGGMTEWDESTVSVVDFSVGGIGYSALHQSGHRALFSADGKLLTAANNHGEWAHALTEALGFNLILTDKNAATVSADANCFFLPFYINQDGSWQSTWDTFVGLKRFRAPVGPILEYFSGIKPPAYYSLSAERALLQRDIDELERERCALERTKIRFQESGYQRTPKVNPENFEEEVGELTQEVSRLNAEQEKVRENLVYEREALESIENQIKAANVALETYAKDSTYMRQEPREVLVCPTCNAEHEESFLQLLDYAEDARVLRELVSQLRISANKLRDQTARTRARLSELKSSYNRVAEILATRRGELTFNDVVNSIGAENAIRSFDDESAKLKGEIGLKLGALHDIERTLKELTSLARSKEILAEFRAAYAAAMVKLNLHPLDTSRLRITSRPDLSGSSGPRSILAYYAAIWTVCLGKHGSFAIPLVIDSPNQQGQDDINLPKVLQFLANDLPAGAQVIVSTEMETDNKFAQTIELTDPYKLLREDEFAEVASSIEPMLSAMYGIFDGASSSSGLG